jgi:subtilase family serine protease
LKKYILTSCFLAVLLYFTANLGGLSASAAASSSSSSAGLSFKQACAQVRTGYASCLAFVSTKSIAAPAKVQAGVASPQAKAPGGSIPYSPASLHTAYSLPTTASGTPTVAIVDAYNDPNAESDLAVYRSNYGLSACTTANGCFKKVSQTGGTSYPTSDAGWSEEISLDLDMVSAICQNCHILLVEASSASFANLGTAVNEAASLGANTISNSYGTVGDVSGESSYCSSYYSHSNVVITASAGDSGPAASFPAVCPSVVGIGGTSLSTSGTETVWSDSGGGCSSTIAKPSWQSSTVTGCSRKAVADVSAVADPNTGVAVYDTYQESGWLQFGGTSVSSPIIASVYALAGGGSTNAASIPWADYTSGCLNTVGGKTYSYQGGLGSPNGISCF